MPKSAARSTNTKAPVDLASSPAAHRRRWGTWTIALALLGGWLWTGLGVHAFSLAGFLFIVVAGLVLVRRRPDIMASLLAAAVSVAVPAAAALALPVWHTGNDATFTVGAFVVVGPVPTLLAWALRPAAHHRALTSWLGSGILLAGALLASLAGSGLAAVLSFAASLVAATVVVWWRWRVGHRDVESGTHRTVSDCGQWTDIGARILGDGTRIDRLVVGPGLVLAAWRVPVRKSDHPGTLRTAIDDGRRVAKALNLPPRLVQPVLLCDSAAAHTRFTTDQDGSSSEPVIARIKVSDSGNTSIGIVIVTSSERLDDLAHRVPSEHGRVPRRARRAALLLPLANHRKTGKGEP